MFYGILQLTDCFLYTCAFLPIRIVIALFQIIRNPFRIFTRGNNKILNSAQIIDLCKGLVIATCCLSLSYADTSMIYHLIRGQTAIKLYIFFNMLEVILLI